MTPRSDEEFSAEPIAIVGNVNLDIKTSVIAASGKILGDGETSVEEIYESLGGGGANTAVAAAHLGGRVHFAGCVGSDELGARLEAALRAYGIVTHLRRKGCVTGRSINLNWDNECRHFVSSLPNNRLMTAEDVDIEGLIQAGCRKLLRADVWFSEPMLYEGNRDLLRRARAAGLETYMDINWDPEWSTLLNPGRIVERRELLANILPFVNCAHGNEQELEMFTGCVNVADACRFLLDRGCSEVVVHRGARGAASFDATDGWTEVPAAPVTSVVSSTGCGDVFCAAHMLLSGLPAAKRLSMAAAIAADHLSGRRVLVPRLNRSEAAREGTA